MFSIALVVAVLATWRGLRAIDDLIGLKAAPRIAQGGLAILAVTALLTPSEFRIATHRFFADDIQQTTDELMDLLLPIIAQIGREPE